MVHARYMLLFLCFLLVSALPISAQELSSDRETTTTESPCPSDSFRADTTTNSAIDSMATTLLPPERKPNLIRRIVNYYSRSNIDRTFERKMDWSIAPGPNYSSDIGFGIGFLVAGLYRLDRTDSLTAPSNISIYGNITTKKFVLLRASGENIYRHNQRRLSYSSAFVYFPGAFYGVGYKAGKQGYAQSLTTMMGGAHAAYSIAVWKQLYLGVSGGLNYSGATHPESHMLQQLEQIKQDVASGGAIPDEHIGELYQLWQQGNYDPQLQDSFSNYINQTGDAPNALNTDIGLFAQYDTRDVSFNAYKGIYAKIELKWYPKFLGNSQENFGRITANFNFYQKLWKGATLAYDLYGDLILGNPSWHMYAKLGGTDRMRGYYEGRYRDKRMVETQIELRQRIYRRHGVVGWFGVGNVWGLDNFQWNNTLYSFGVGYRFEFKKRMNIRLDYGWGVHGNQNLPWDRKRSSAFMFTASEAF